jgi:hypothetical protein
MIIYRIAASHCCPVYLFSIEDIERQLDKWHKEGRIFVGTIEEIFVNGNNPFLNNFKLIN